MRPLTAREWASWYVSTRDLPNVHMTSVPRTKEAPPKAPKRSFGIVKGDRE